MAGTEMYHLPVLEVTSLRSRSRRVGSLEGCGGGCVPGFWTRLVGGQTFLFTWHSPRACACVLMSPSVRIPVGEGPPSCAHFKEIASVKTLFPNNAPFTLTWGRTTTSDWGGRNSTHSTSEGSHPRGLHSLSPAKVKPRNRLGRERKKEKRRGLGEGKGHTFVLEWGRPGAAGAALLKPVWVCPCSSTFLLPL